MSRAGFVVLCAVAGCVTREPYGGAFDVPIAVAVLQPEVGGPFQEPVGFVANHHGGEIVPLALKQGRFLTDDATVAFLRGNPLPTGGLRLLTSVAVTSSSVREATVWAGDQRFGKLLRVPWLVDCEVEPDRPECDAPDFGAPVEQGVFREVVASPDGLVLDDLRVKHGYTTTETWTVTYDGTAWWVEGTRSGRQPEPARTGRWWSIEPHRLSFTVRDPDGRAKAGDQFVVKTRSGLEEIEVGGSPTALSLSPDGRLLAMVVEEAAGAALVWFDPAARAVLNRVDLPADAMPGRLTWTEDGSLLVTDLVRPAVWEVAPGGSLALEHVMPWPTLDVAELDGVLFVTPDDGTSLWRFDRATDVAFDVNPTVEGTQGLPLTSTILGLEAIPLPYRMPEYDDDGIRLFGRAVAVSLSSGAMVFAHEETGCLVQNNLGPRSVYDPNSIHLDYAASFDDVYGGAVLEENGASTRHVLVNACAGLAPAELWTLRYDEVRQGWTVTGSYSGVQSTLAIEDERYLSDRGEVSFVIRSGSVPSRDGWTVTFAVDSGVAVATGANADDSLRDVSLGVSGDPVAARWRAGLAGPIGDHDGSGWYAVDLRTVLVVPGASTNEVGRVDPQQALVDVGWE